MSWRNLTSPYRVDDPWQAVRAGWAKGEAEPPLDDDHDLLGDDEDDEDDDDDEEFDPDDEFVVPVHYQGGVFPLDDDDEEDEEGEDGDDQIDE